MRDSAFAATGPVAVRVPTGAALLDGDLSLPENASGIVLFAHGSGSSRMSPRNRAVASALQARRLGTLLLDLLTPEEDLFDRQTAALRFDIGMLAERLVEVTRWVVQLDRTRNLPIGYFGASTGGGAALVAAAELPGIVRAVVSRGGRPDLAGTALPRVEAATLLIVGGNDPTVLALNREALSLLRAEKRLHVVPGATHLFSEPGALEEVARLAGEWFHAHLAADAGASDEGIQ